MSVFRLQQHAPAVKSGTKSPAPAAGPTRYILQTEGLGQKEPVPKVLTHQKSAVLYQGGGDRSMDLNLQ